MADPEHVEILKQGVEVWNKWREDNPGIEPELSGIDINKIAESGNSKVEVIHGRCDLRGVNLSRAILNGAKFINADLLDAGLNGAQIDHANFTSANFTNANLNNVHGKEAMFTRAVFLNSEISGADIYKANFEEVRIAKTDLSGSEFSGAIFIGAELYRANLQRAYLLDCDFSSSKLIDSNLENAKLHYANLSEMYLKGVNFKGTNLAFANLEHTLILGASFRVSSLQKNYRGIRVSTCFGNQLFKTFAQDQDFIEELRASGKRGAFLFWVWWLFADCGRSFLRWAGWSLLFAFSFAAFFFFVLKPSAFVVEGPPAGSFLTMFYYSVVTFTTLGFGDITPTTTGAMWAVMAEVILGYIMLGGLISILANKLARRS